MPNRLYKVKKKTILQQKNKTWVLILASKVQLGAITILLPKQTAATAVFLEPEGIECLA